MSANINKQHEANDDAQTNHESNTSAEVAPEDENPTEILEGKILELKDQLLRALADKENTRKRAQAEQLDTMKYAISKFATDMLTIADNLQRAIDAADQTDEKVKPVIEGIQLTQKELEKTFEKHGISAIFPLGKAFDPNFHQAVLESESDTYNPGEVMQVMQTGYTLEDRLLRPAMVVVVKNA